MSSQRLFTGVSEVARHRQRLKQVTKRADCAQLHVVSVSCTTDADDLQQLNCAAVNQSHDGHLSVVLG